MKGDFTRSTFKKEKHYDSVRMQQGRVQLDADWNEQMDIQAYLSRTEAMDVIGRTGVPKYGGGFNIGISANGQDLTISPGRIYVDGILCELEEPGTTCKTQPDFTFPPTLAAGDYLVYLDAWQQHVTALEDEAIREKALAGPDSATRTRTAWQVKLQRSNTLDCRQIGPGWAPTDAKSTGKITARAKPGDPSDDPCILPPGAGYRRQENQLYRVEIHQGGGANSPGNATFKWSRENGTVVARIEDISGLEITLSHAVQSRLSEFIAGQWIEVIDDKHEIDGKPGPLVKISKMEGNKLTIESGSQIGSESITLANFPKSKNAKVRRWDSSLGADDVEIPATNDGFILLEDGVEIKFNAGETADPAHYCSGDYWLIPARNAIADIEWPKDSTNPNNYIYKNPDGIKHHYCQLGMVKINSQGNFNSPKDCRESFPPLNEVTIGKGCCTVSVGDGRSSFGDTDSLDEAIGKVQQGGQICLLPGVHKANVSIRNGENISIRGCGKFTRVIPDENNRSKPVFKIENSKFISLENMEIINFGGTAIQIGSEESDSEKTREIRISGNRIFALKNAVCALQGERIEISENRIRMLDRADGDAAVFILAERSIIRDNDIGVVPAAELKVKNLRESRGVPDLSDPDADVESIYEDPSWLTAFMNLVWEATVDRYPVIPFKACGGIQVAGGSDGIEIVNNRLIGGAWNGITLGHIPLDMDDEFKSLAKKRYGLNGQSLAGDTLKRFKTSFSGLITNLVIDENEIRLMGLNGIGVVNFFGLNDVGEMVSVDELRITNNTIVECLQQLPATIEPAMALEMALAGIVLADCENLTIRENRIDQNGAQLTVPACGIFIRHGERIDISDNRILNNGTKTAVKDQGVGGGIVIMLVNGKMINDFVENVTGELPLIDGVPAVKIHDNIVTQPVGKALTLLALGPVSVVGNHFTSQGIDANVKYLPKLAGAVLIIDLGISRDLFAHILVSGLKNMMRSVPANTGQLALKTGAVNAQPKYFTSAGLLTYTNIAFQPANFYCINDSRDAIGAVGIANIPSEEAADTQTNKVQEILIYLPTGSVLFANNQTTLDLRSKKSDFAVSSQLIFSLDDISYLGNQSECNSRLDAVMTDVFTLGNTIRTSDNRFQEGITLAIFSLVSIGLMMNTWTGNQASHCLTALGVMKESEGNNLVLYENLYFDLVEIADKSFCQLAHEGIHALVKPGQAQITG